MSSLPNNRGWLRSIAAVAFVAATGYAICAQAGECPADKRMPNARQPVNLPAVRRNRHDARYRSTSAGSRRRSPTANCASARW